MNTIELRELLFGYLNDPDSLTTSEDEVWAYLDSLTPEELIERCKQLAKKSPKSALAEVDYDNLVIES